MILIAKVDWLNPLGISITDWIQALAAFFAVLGAIYAFIKLFRKDKEKQMQIDSLTTLAGESENQTSQIANQVEQMIESNRLQTEYLKLFQESISIDKDASNLDQERKELEDKRRKIAIKPRFEFSTSLKTLEYFKLNLINKGEKAIIKEFIELERNSVKHNIKQWIDKEVNRNERVDILFNPKPIGLSINECFVDVQIVYEDIDGGKYYQLISGPGSRVKINPPVEMEKD